MTLTTVERLMRAGLAALALGALVIGCGNDADDSSEADASHVRRTHETPATTDDAPTAVTTPSDSFPIPEDADVAEDIEPGVRGGELVLPIGASPKSFNPLFGKSVGDQEAAGLMFSGLHNYDYVTQRTVPGLAKSWEYDEDTRTWTFNIRRGVRWSDGMPLTAQDFVFYSEVVFDPQVPNPYHFFFRLERSPESPAYEFSAPTSHTLQVRIPGIDSFAFINLGLVRALPRHVMEPVWKAGKFREDYWAANVDPDELVVSGPYKVVSIRTDEAIVFEPNPHYWRVDPAGNRLPYIQRLILRQAEDTEAIHIGFIAGAFDVLEGIKHANLPEFLDRQEQEDFTVYPLGPSLNTTHLYFNMILGGTYVDDEGNRVKWRPSKMGEQPPADLRDFKPFVAPEKQAWFYEREFRVAVSEAIDRPRIVDSILYGEGAPLYGPVPPANEVWHADSATTYPYNPQSARARLEGIGMIDRDGDGLREDRNGRTVRFTILSNKENDVREQILLRVVNDLNAIGLEAQSRVIEFNSLIQAVDSTYDFDAILLGLGTGVPPHPAMGGSFWPSSGKVHAWHPAQLAPQTEWEARLDSMYNQLKKEFDLDAQRAIFAEMQELLAYQQPAIHLVSPNVYIAARNKIGNLKPSIIRSSATHNIDELYILPEARR